MDGTMWIIEDTRQQAGKHRKKHEWWEQNGDELIRCKLPFGDYSLPPKVAIDTKANLTEIATNMCGAFKERRRFKDECVRARDCGCKLIFLVECGKEHMEDLFGISVMLGNGSTLKGVQFVMAMQTMSSRYGCEFELVKPSKCAQRINEILNGKE